MLPHRLFSFCRRTLFRLRGGTRYRQEFHNKTLIEGFAGKVAATDISDHLSHLFFFAVDAKPKLIVELGTRGGESTRALLSAASLTNATMLSVDIDDCANPTFPYRDRWHFVKADDVAFGKNDFSKWCSSRGLEPRIDLLFIDTSHLYEHTKQEIEVWSRFLSDEGMMIFHDSNMGRGIFSHLDGSIAEGWNNERGVIRAIEEFVGKRYDENSFFTDIANGFLILHHPHCNGLTVLKKMNASGKQ